MQWNETGIYLEAGCSLTFSLTSERQDSNDICDWKGTEDGKLTAGNIVREVRKKAAQDRQTGKFYSFPNDVWGLYKNNEGSIRLMVTRV